MPRIGTIRRSRRSNVSFAGSVVLTIGFAALVVAPDCATAGFISSSTGAISGHDPENSDLGLGAIVLALGNEGELSSSAVSDTAGGIASAFATPGTIRASAQAFAKSAHVPLPQGSFGFEFGFSFGNAHGDGFAQAAGVWQDTISINSAADPAPERLLLTFQVDGSFAFDISHFHGPLEIGIAGFSVLFREDASLGAAPSEAEYLILRQSLNSGTESEVSLGWADDWDGGNSFSGTVVLDVAVGTTFEIGGRAWAYAGAGEAIVSSNFGNTMTLTSILLPDGTTPESRGYTVAFESGFDPSSAAAVPEPTGFVLWGPALALAIAAHVRRKRRATAS